MIKHALPLVALALVSSAGCSSSSNAYDGGNNGDGGAKTVVINEVFAGGTSVTDPDWIELKNLTGAAIDLGGYQLRDNALTDLSPIPAGNTIEAGGYFIVYCDDQKDGGIAGGVHVPWKLSSSKGDEVHLLNAGGAEIDATTFGVDVPADKSWGRLPDGTGAFLRTSPTQGMANL
jgi:hypothetical protein